MDLNVHSHQMVSTINWRQRGRAVGGPLFASPISSATILRRKKLFTCTCCVAPARALLLQSCPNAAAATLPSPIAAPQLHNLFSSFFTFITSLLLLLQLLFLFGTFSPTAIGFAHRLLNAPMMITFASADTLLCAPGSSFSAASTAIVTPDTYTAVGCRFSGAVTFKCDGLASSVADSPLRPTAVEVSAGSVAAGPANALIFIAPTLADAPAKGPLLINVRGMAFEASTVIRLEGALPPASAFVVTGSTFVMNDINTVSAAGVTTSLRARYCVLINSLFTTLPLYLTGGSKIEVSNNVAAVNVPYDAAAPQDNSENFYFVYARGTALTISGGSNLTVSGNSFSAPQANCTTILMLASQGALDVSGGSTVAVDNNAITAVTARNDVRIAHTYSDAALYSIRDRSVVRYSRNTVRGATGAASTSRVMVLEMGSTIGGFEISGASSFFFSSNQVVDSYAVTYVSGIFFTGNGISLLGASRVAITDTVVSNAMPAAFYIADITVVYIDTRSGSLLITDGSALVATGNGASQVKTRGAYGPYINVRELNIRNASSLDASGSFMSAVISTGDVIGAYLRAAVQATVTGGSLLRADACGIVPAPPPAPSSTVTGSAVIAVYISYLLFSVTLGGTASFSRNTIGAIPISGSLVAAVSTPAAADSSLTIASGGSVAFSDNSVSGTTPTSGSTYNVNLFRASWSRIAASGADSVFVARNNSIVRTKGNQLILILMNPTSGLGVAATAGGAIIFEQNSIGAGCDVADLSVVLYSTHPTITASGANSRFLFDYNSAVDYTTASNFFLTYIVANGAISASGTGAVVSLSNNFVRSVNSSVATSHRGIYAAALSFSAANGARFAADNNSMRRLLGGAVIALFLSANAVGPAAIASSGAGGGVAATGSVFGFLADSNASFTADGNAVESVTAWSEFSAAALSSPSSAAGVFGEGSIFSVSGNTASFVTFTNTRLSTVAQISVTQLLLLPPFPPLRPPLSVRVSLCVTIRFPTLRSRGAAGSRRRWRGWWLLPPLLGTLAPWLRGLGWRWLAMRPGASLFLAKRPSLSFSSLSPPQRPF